MGGYCKVENVSEEDLNLSLWNCYGEKRASASLPAGSTRYIATWNINFNDDNDTIVKITVNKTGDSWGTDNGLSGLWKRLPSIHTYYDLMAKRWRRTGFGEENENADQ